MTHINPDAPTRFYVLDGCTVENTALPPVGKTERVYLFVRDYIQQVGYAPSLREITHGLKLGGYSTARYQVGKLIDAGLLIRSGEHTAGRTLILAK